MKYFAAAPVLLAVLALSSCKEPIPGCTDPDAENFSFEAEEDDGTCFYIGNAVFYHNTTTGQQLINAGVTSVKLYVDDFFKDSMSPNIGFNFTPTCNSENAMNFNNYGLANSKSKMFGYKIKDQNGNLLSAGTFVLEGGKCTTVQYPY
jgi:hypothetical protein